MDVQVPTRTLIEALVRTDGTVDAAELYEVAGGLGMSDQQVRLCLKRLEVEGRLSREGRGRRARLRMSRQAIQSAEPDLDFVRFMYRQDDGEVKWDGVWHLASFAVPESARPARDALRDALVRLGGAALHPGLYVSPHEWEDLVTAEARELGVLDSVTFLSGDDLRVGEERDPAALCALLWPLDDIAARHSRLLEVARLRLRRLSSESLSRVQVLCLAVELAAEFTRAVEPDPLLPPALLPQPWVGTRARSVVAQCWSALAARTEDLPALFRLYTALFTDVA